MAKQTVNIKGVAAGSANITVASKSDPTKKGVVKVTVVDGSIRTDSVSGLIVGGTQPIAVAVNGIPSGYTVSWFVEPDSGKEGYATVKADASDQTKAIITGVLEGGGRVGAKVTLKNLEWTDSSRVECGPAVVMSESISVDPKTLSVDVGATGNISATILPSNTTNKKVDWRSSDETIATVSTSGVVTGVKAGTATINAAANDNGSHIDTCAVTVTNPVVAVTGVSVAPKTSTLEVGKSSTITATVSPSNATDKTVTWNSSDTKIATVTQAGKVTGVAPGDVQIFAVSHADRTKVTYAAITVTAAEAA